MKGKTSLSKSKRAGFLITSLLLVILISFAIGEIIFRVKGSTDLKSLINPIKAKKPMLKWAFVNPYAGYTPIPDRKISKENKTVNNFGFISTPSMESVSKPEGTIRIAFLGGSSTAGTGRNLPDDQTFPWKVRMKLEKALPNSKIEAINASVSGYSSFESLGRLWSEIRFFEPDIVIVNHGWNDMYYFDDCSKEKITHWRWGGDQSWGFREIELPPKIKTLASDKWFTWSRIYAMMRLATGEPLPLSDMGEIGKSKKSDSELSDSFDERCPEVLNWNFEAMRELSGMVGAEFYVLKQPTLVSKKLPHDARALCLTWYHTFNYDAHLKAYQAIYHEIDKSFDKEKIIDATRMSGNPDFFFDHVHPNNQGTEVISKIISSHLLKFSKRLK